MKTLIILLALTLPAMAQGYTPRTVPLISNTTKEVIGSATFSGNRIFLRNKQNEIFAQIVIEANGGRVMYDASGNVLDRIEAEKK
jgi:hypothetical protein